MTKNCDFCNYDDFENQILYDDKDFYVIYPRRPIFKYHLMVVPKNHSATYDELSPEVAGGLAALVGKLKAKLANSQLEGYNMFSNNGSKKVGQHVPHFHLHLFIRYEDEEISPYAIMNDSSLRAKLSDEEHENNKQEIQQLLN